MVDNEELDYEFSSSESEEEYEKVTFDPTNRFSWRPFLKRSVHKKICSTDRFFSLNSNSSKHKPKSLNALKKAFQIQKEIHDSNFTIIRDCHLRQDMPCSSGNKISTADPEADSDCGDFSFSLINLNVTKTDPCDFSITAFAAEDNELKEKQSSVFSNVCPNYFLSTPCETVKCPLLHDIPPDRLDWYDFETVLEQYNYIKTQPVLNKVFSIFLKYFIAHGNKDVLVDLFDDVSDDANAHFLSDIIDGLVTLGMAPVDAVNIAIHQTRPIGQANYVLLNYIIKANLIAEIRFLEQLIGWREEPLPMQFVGNLINLFISRHSSNIELGLYIKTRVFDALDQSEVKKFPPFCINTFMKIISKHL